MHQQIVLIDIWKKENKTAIIWVGDDPKVQKKFLIKNYIKKFPKLQMV